jgi:hypothetical protein
MSSIATTLTQARSLIEDEKDWYPGPARTRVGDVGGEARYCAQTAISTSGSGDFDSYVSSLYAIADAIGVEYDRENPAGVFQPIWDWNDSSDHATVLAAFDKAIAAN